MLKRIKYELVILKHENDFFKRQLNRLRSLGKYKEVDVLLAEKIESIEKEEKEIRRSLQKVIWLKGEGGIRYV